MTVIVVDMVNSLTSSDFPPTDVTSTVLTASIYISGEVGRTIAIDTTDESDAMVLSMLAAAMLLEGRKVIRSRTENVFARTIDKLFTDEMRSKLTIGDVQSPSLIRVTNITPTKTW